MVGAHQDAKDIGIIKGAIIANLAHLFPGIAIPIFSRRAAPSATGTLPALNHFAHQIGGIIDRARATIADRDLGHHRLARNMIIAEPRIASRAARLGVTLFRSLLFRGLNLASKCTARRV